MKTPSGLAIVEIQGTLNSTGAAPLQQRDGGSALPIGKLVFPYYDASKSTEDISWQKRVYLYVGKHQRLTGEVKKLANPIAVLQKKSQPNPGASSSDNDELEIVEVVYYKLLFAHRPEPVGGRDE